MIKKIYYIRVSYGHNTLGNTVGRLPVRPRTFGRSSDTRGPKLHYTSAGPDTLLNSIMADFTMVNPKFVWGAQAYTTISSYGTVYAGKMDFMVQISI